jgi:hypothetical protein
MASSAAWSSVHYVGLFRTDDRLEMLKAFTEKRPPKFEGR